VSADALFRRRRSYRVGRILRLTLVLALTVALVAGIVHIVTIFLVPHYVPSDGWTRLARVSAGESFAVLEDEARQRPAVPGLDPLFVHAACRLDLAEHPALVTLRAPDRFWSLALFNPRGIVVFSLNDRTATAGELHMLAVTPAQNAQLKESPPEGIEDTIVVESEATDLIALVRLYAPTEGARRAARQIATAAGCAAFPLTLEGEDS
jgi:uncharacterized membrane protein